MRPTFIAVAAFGLIVAVAIAAGGWWLAGEVHRTLDDTLTVAGDAVAAGRDTISVAGTTLDELDAGLLALESGLDAAGGAFAELPPVIGELSTLSAIDLPAGLAAVAGTAGALGELASGLDQALRPLRIVGVEAAPVADLTQSLDEIQSNLDGLPERLAAQAVRLEAAAASLGTVEGEVDTLVAQVEATRIGLEDAADLVEQYQATADEAADLVDSAASDLDRQVLVGRVLALLLAAAIAALQAVPLLLAADRRRDATAAVQPREADTLAA